MTLPPSEAPRPPEQSVPRLSLRNKLLVFAFALVALPGALLGALATRNASAALETAIGRALAREAGHTADHLSSVLRADRQTLASFARQDLMRDVRVADLDKRVSMALATLRAGDSLPHQYFVVDLQARVVAASEPRMIGELPAWAESLGLGRAARDGIVGPLGAPHFDHPRLVMTSAIPDPDDPARTLGTLVGVFDWAALTAVTRTVQSDLAAQEIAVEVLVCAEDGTILGGARAANATHETSGVVERGALEAARAPLVAPDWAVQPATGLIVGRAALARDLPRWRLLVAEPRALALAPVASLQRRMALTLGVVLVAALLVAGIAARRVVRPLSELTAAIRGLARGGARSVPVRSDDEVGALAGSFNRMSAELARAQHDLVEAEKFAFVGELAAGVAHEIRTSLGVLKSSVHILDRALPAEANDEVRELAQMIREEVGRLGGVVDDLLTLNPARPLRLEAGPLAPIVLRAADFASHSARTKGVRILRAALPASEANVAREPELIYQVAVNLLVNAVQALGDGGVIEVAILPPREGYGGFEVRDNGPGIPEGLRERIFQPFVTGRSGGVGLGLTFVKRVVHEHRGRISIASEPGAGTRVRVELPLAEVTP